MAEIPFPGGAADQDVFFHEDKVCVYHKAINTWECRTVETGTAVGQPAAVTTRTVYTIPIPTDDTGTVAPSPTSLPDLRTQYDVNWFVVDDTSKRARKVLVQDTAPTSYPDFTDERAELINGDLWYDTSRLELFLYWNNAWFPTSAPPADYDLEIEQFQYGLNRLQELLDEIYLKNVRQDERLDGIDNDIIELEEEIEALAPSLERGNWNYTQPLELRGYSLFDVDGIATNKYTNARSIFVTPVDVNGTSHSFDDVVDGSYIEIFASDTSDFGLYNITGITDKTNLNPGYWVFDVNFIKSNSVLATADGPARFKFFELADAADPTAFVAKSGDEMSGKLTLSGSNALDLKGKIQVNGTTTNSRFLGTDSNGNTSWKTALTSHVQADWNTTSTTSASYIKNKPTIPSAPTYTITKNAGNYYVS